MGRKRISPPFLGNEKGWSPGCLECNSRKGERRAEDFLRLLYREGRLTGAELIRGLQSLKDLAAGKLRPELPENGK